MVCNASFRTRAHPSLKYKTMHKLIFYPFRSFYAYFFVPLSMISLLKFK